MPGCARKEIVDPTVVGVYHCISRCVRRAFLCGQDPLSGFNYDHRKIWIEERVRLLVRVFAMEVLSSSVMGNHMHQEIRTRPDLAGRWSDEEVARRWWQVHPLRTNRDGSPADMSENDLAMSLADSERIDELRTRLSSLSWFMKELKENIARRANAEDDVTGHFWEGRFKSPRLLDDAAVLMCSVYIDLNPIRAGIAAVPEEAAHTSAFDRIAARQMRRQEVAEGGDKREDEGIVEYPDSWLTPISELGESDNLAAPQFRLSDNGFLPMGTEQYLQLLDWTGRQLRDGKRSAIPSSMATILQRLELRREEWLDSIASYQQWVHRAVGRVERMAEAAAQAGLSWLHGVGACRRAFS